MFIGFLREFWNRKAKKALKFYMLPSSRPSSGSRNTVHGISSTEEEAEEEKERSIPFGKLYNSSKLFLPEKAPLQFFVPRKKD